MSCSTSQPQAQGKFTKTRGVLVVGVSDRCDGCSKDDDGFNGIVENTNDKNTIFCVPHEEESKDSGVKHGDNLDVNDNVKIPNKVDSPPVNTFSDGDLTNKEMLDYVNKLARLAIETGFTRDGGAKISISELFSSNEVDQEVVGDKIMISKDLLDSYLKSFAMDAHNGYSTEDNDSEPETDSVAMTTSIKNTTPKSKAWGYALSENQSDDGLQEISLNITGILGDLPNNLTFPTSTSIIKLTTSLTEDKKLAREKRESKKLMMMDKLRSERSKLSTSVTNLLDYKDNSSPFPDHFKNYSRRMLLSTDLYMVKFIDAKVIHQLKQDARFLLAKIIHHSFTKTSGHTNMALVNQCWKDEFLNRIGEVRIAEDDSNNTRLLISFATQVADEDECHIVFRP